MVDTLLLALLLATLPDAPPPGASLILRNFMQEIETTTLLDDAQRGAKISRWFSTDLSRLDPHSMADRDLRDFFRASLNASSLARDRQIATVARTIFDELDSRGMLEESDYRNMQGVYIRLREFDVAKRFAQAHGSRATLEKLPEIASAPDLDASLPSEFVLAGNGALRWQNFNPAGRTFVLVVADPLCHFTQDALKAIHADPILRQYFAGNSKWLRPDGLSLDLDAVRTWNHAFPEYPLSLVNEIRNWKDIAYWDTPTFYFFEHGQVVQTLRGWPPEGHADELKSFIAQTGITRTGR